MSPPSAPLVSVVVPAYNAAATLAATVRSACAQTWRELEIIIVDDGSRDDTLTVARSLEAEDPRVRVLAKANGGVSAARNDAIRASSGAFIAPLDSDDLWKPEKIERQMHRMAELGPDCGLVYCLSHVIDDRDRVLRPKGAPGFEGAVFLRSVLCNFVGNGSAPLFRRAALEEVGGYDVDSEVLSAEDWLIQIFVARRWRVGFVPERLVGYRVSAGSLSSQVDRHRRAKRRAIELVRARFPDTPADVLAAAESFVRADGAVDALRAGRPVEAAREAASAIALSPGGAGAAAGAWIGRLARAARRRVRAGGDAEAAGPGFFDADPRASYGPPAELRAAALLDRLAAREAGFARAASS